MIELRDLVKNNESILWEGRPDKITTVLEAIFNPMLLVAIVWGGFDLFAMSAIPTGEIAGQDGNLIIVFFLIHLMPVWIYLIGVVTVFLRWRNVRFMVTTHGLYVSGGLIAFNYEMKPWTDIGHINIHQGAFDRMFRVGDVIFVCSHGSYQNTSSNGHSEHHNLKIYNIPDFQEVFKMVNNLQTDVYSDTMYPNALRPEDNPGYNTRYTRNQ